MQYALGMQVAALPTNPQNRLKASPRLMEAALWALSRWCNTYIAPETLDPSNDLSDFPAACAPLVPSDPAAAISHALTSLAVCLSNYPSETSLHRIAVSDLLRVLVCRPKRSALLATLPAWHEFQTIFASRPFPGPFAMLHSSLHRELAKAVATDLVDRDVDGDGRAVKAQALQQLFGPALEEVQQFEGLSNGSTAVAKVANRGDVVRTSCRGAALVPQSLQELLSVRCLRSISSLAPQRQPH
jgi:hypothetical protein